MKYLKILMFIGLFSIQSHAYPEIRVAVIDTGLDKQYFNSVKLCKTGHKDFTGEGFHDVNGHGTNIVGLITQTAKPKNYCIIILKAYSPTQKRAYFTEALRHAYDLNVNIINLSGGGLYPLIKEREIVKKILNKNITLVTAAGNNGSNLDIDCNFYPACYDPRIYVVGSYNGFSNYGKVVDIKYNGTKQTAFGYTFSGTSQSTAIFTSYLLKKIETLSKTR